MNLAFRRNTATIAGQSDSRGLPIQSPERSFRAALTPRSSMWKHLGEGAMDPEESWDKTVEKLNACFEKLYRSSDETAMAALPGIDVKDSLKRADWLNIRDAVTLIQHELGVIQFDAQETLIKGCASGVWSRFVFPNQSEMLFSFIDPRWWQADLSRIKFPQGLFRNDNGFEITEGEIGRFFISVESLLLSLTNRGWSAKRGQLQWYPLIGTYGPITPERVADSKKPKGDGSVTVAIKRDDVSGRPLRPASDSMIDSAINDTYTEADHAGVKPPNIIEIVAPVQERLRTKGYQASGRQIQRLADANKYRNRRRKPGATVTSAKGRQKADF